MALSAIFAKPINRPIEGVIKADDEASLRLEVEEYVLTNEVAKRLENFLYAYNNYNGANGVWISGFFGSGKSHLLKILALLLENREVEGTPILDLFLSKCGDNEILRADLQRAAAIPSRSILFNIDQKADIISKTQIDALLAVFVKVFDEMCGYYGKQGHIARFERDLDSRGLYDSFKQTYRQISGRAWETGREQALLEAPHIASAYTQVTGTPAAAAQGILGAQGILDKYRAEYKVSIEDFAEQVNDYIARQRPNFRLNFFVDEVGQYIAENVKLMTNLQTIAESLATKCRGRAWLVVTAQEDMSDVVGEMGKQQSNDFSKIQARFANRMKLTSTDVAEVIRKRLLLKNDQGIAQLSAVYAQQHNNFKTLFDFADGSQTYRNFRDRDDFIHSYPFIPYQFPLFQRAIQQLSEHNAFEGKHSSVGERSMLGVFQQVVVHIAGYEVGQLATFDLMFEGIRTTLKSQIQWAVPTAEKNLNNPFATQVLKALFLVKYIKEFKATPRNLTVLLLNRFDADLPALRKRIEEALNLLEQQTYIQRNGEQYEYLTDEEKDVEEEIKNTEVDTDAVAEELGKLIFDTVIKERKIRYDENGQDYPFSRKLDDRLLGREYELAIHVISPFHEHVGNEAVLRAQALGRDELLVLMPVHDRLLRDLLMYKRTEKYIRQNISVTQQDSIRRILSDKQVQNGERYGTLRTLVGELLGQAKLVVGGQDLDINGSDAQIRVVRGFHALLLRTYPNLRMLRGITYSENDIDTCLRPSVTLLGGDAATFSEAEQEVFAFAQSNHRSGVRTTLQSLVSRFERKPYGWYLAAVQCTLAKLCARGKIEVRRDGTLLEEAELGRALRNTHGYANLVLDPQIEFTPAQIRQLRDFYAEFFDTPPTANEARALGKETAAAFQSLQQELTGLRNQAVVYPFLVVLDEPMALLQKLIGQPYAFYLTELRRQENVLLDGKEKVLDPVRGFMRGAHKQIYDEARRFLESQEPNFLYVEGPEVGQLRAILNDPACYKGAQMTQAKTLLEGLKTKMTQQVQQEKTTAMAAIAERWVRLTNTAEFAALIPEQQTQLKRPFDGLQHTIERQTLIAVMRDTLRQFDLTSYPGLLRQMVTWAQPLPAAATPAGIQPKVVVEPRVEYVPQYNLTVPFDKPWLADETDIDAYLTALKQAMMQAIQEGKKIQI